MTADKTQALVLRAIPFGETSAIVTLLTRDHGKVRGLAKGAWRPKSSFDAALDLLSVCQVLVLRRSASGLDLLTEAFLEQRFRVGRCQAAVAAGLYLAELLDAVTVDADSQPSLFDLARKTVGLLSQPRPGSDWARPAGPADDTASIAALLVHAELGILRDLGEQPALHRCAECGTPLGDGRVAFGLLAGGGLCARCRRGQRPVVSVSAAAIGLLRQLAVAPVALEQDQPQEKPTPAALGEVRAVMNTVITNLLGRRLKTSRWLTTSLASSSENHR